MAAREDPTDDGFQPLRDDIRGLGVMLEDMRSGIAAIGEGLGDVARKSDVRALAREVRQNSADVRLLRDEVAQLRLQFDRRELGVEELERRMAEVEKRLGVEPRR